MLMVKKGDKGDVGPSFPASVESVFYTSFVDTKEEGLLIITSPWLIPNHLIILRLLIKMKF